MIKRLVWLSVFLLVGGLSAQAQSHEECGTASLAPSSLRQFGVPYLELPGPDISHLPEQYQQMAMRLSTIPAHERPPLICCFAPGTDPEIVNTISQLLYGPFSPLDFQLNTRWSSTVINGGTGSQGDSITLTFSFVPDGTTIPSGVGEPSASSVLFRRFNALFGDTSIWKPKFRAVFARWSDLAGINYVETVDDGASMFGSGGSLGVRGDVRIGSKYIDGASSILAYNYFPNGGDMVLDSAESWNSSTSNYVFLRNTIAHEHGHGFGLSHVCPTNSTKLMEPYLNTNFDGGQHDDVRGAQRHYGDAREGNDTSTLANNLGTLGNGTTTVNDVSCDNATDNDWYKFTVVAGKAVALTLHPVGLTYLEGPQDADCGTNTSITTTDDQDLSMTLVGTNGSTVLATANSQPAGVDEVISTYNLTAAGTYYVRVLPQAGATTVQMYQLSLLISAAANTITVGSPNGGEIWYTGTTQAISWTSNGVSGNVRIDINRTYPSVTWETLIASTANDGSENWSVSGATGSTNRIRIVSVTTPTIGDSSDANFTLSLPTITVGAPNGGEVYFLGTAYTINWSSVAVSGNVNVELNRNYAGGAWEALFTNIANDGNESWTASGATSTNARIRVASTSTPAINDVSNAAFTISNPMVTVTRPNGGESLNGAGLEEITWTSGGFSGNVTIELDRDYPTGGFVTLTTVPNSGSYVLTLGGPPTTTARIRVTSVSAPVATDISNANFTITAPNAAPSLYHAPHQDAAAGNVLFVATALDDYSTPTVSLHKRVAGVGSYDSTALAATGNPGEYSILVALIDNTYEYFLRAYDAQALSATTDTFTLDVGACALPTVVQDDGTAEGYNWSGTPGFEWAIKITPTATPYALCQADVAVAAAHPDSFHTSIRVRVLSADGPGGLPGTELWNEVSGSIGNQIGGLPVGPVYWASTLIKDGLGGPLTVTGPFYIAVSDPEPGKHEAFGRDANSSAANSYYYDACDLAWHSEADALPNAQHSARMIRAHGSALSAPSTLVISPSGNNILLNWQSTGAPYYRIYAGSSVSGPFTTLLGSTSTTSFTDIGVVPSTAVRFYLVVASTEP
ncbi:matrixin family metalloprotease [candidate division KSB1 bacterium]|nr:matrixin family metalloprotease [candidate division KSB1 bacterium]